MHSLTLFHLFCADPPSPIIELEDSEVDIGSVTWLKCSYTGNPRPKYSWNYFQTDNVMEENEDGVSRLIIHNATAANMGFYTCHAWNDIGNVSKTAKVTVKGRVSIMLLPRQGDAKCFHIAVLCQAQSPRFSDVSTHFCAIE